MFTIGQVVEFMTSTGIEKKGVIVATYERMGDDYFTIVDFDRHEYQGVPDFVVTGNKHRGHYYPQYDEPTGSMGKHSLPTASDLGLAI